MIRFYFLFFLFLNIIITKKPISSSELCDIYDDLINKFNGSITINKTLNYSHYYLIFDNFLFLTPHQIGEKPDCKKENQEEIHIKNLNFTLLTNITLKIFEDSTKYFPMNEHSIEIVYDSIKILGNKTISEFKISNISISKSYDIMYYKYFKNFQNGIDNKTGDFTILLNSSIYNRTNNIKKGIINI